MIDLSHLKGRSFAVLGLGATGMAAAEALKAAGVTVTVWDDRLVGRTWADRAGVPLRPFETEGFGEADSLVLSPGIPRSWPRPHPAVARAEREGVALVSDIDLLAQAQPEARFIGVTGTNGKSTTTALIAHILETANIPMQVGGNLSPPALALDPLGPGGWYVLELSSYQLETVQEIAWEIGLLLNVTADHLDRYPGMTEYAAAKARLIQAIRPGGTAVIGVDDEWSRTVAPPPGVTRVTISNEGPADVSADGGLLRPAPDGPALLDLREAPALPGAHNWQNAAAAFAACRAADAPEEVIVRGMLSFPGLRHRQQRVDTVAGVTFVNDSKATNPDAAAKALGSYEAVYWIAGGRPKQGGLDALEPFLPRLRHACLIGEGAEKFAGFLEGRVPYSRATDLDAATSEAFQRAREDGVEGAVVLLSPACASWDQFVNFEARGDAFIASVAGIRHRESLKAGGGS